ncbi:MAG: serine/threonine-protein kinase [Isosphaeraceae bacterium]
MSHDDPDRPSGMSWTGTRDADPCPASARFWQVALGKDVWSPAERRHVSDCPQCSQAERQVRSATAAWDPSHDRNEPVPVNRLQQYTPWPRATSQVHSDDGDLTVTTDIRRGAGRDSVTHWVGPAVSMPHRQTLGHYEIVRELARGGMGVVYLARDERLCRTVAIKVMSTFGREPGHVLDRFMAEARALARLSHPSVMPILDIGQHHDLTYIVTPFIEGQTLGALYRGAPLDPREAARLIAEVADAVQYCHGRGVLHRDIKPSNVLLDPEGRPLLMDFGLAKVSDSEATLSTEGMLMGTPAYMSPEQTTGRAREVGPASDIYSPGDALLAAATGRPRSRAPRRRHARKAPVGGPPEAPRPQPGRRPRPGAGLPEGPGEGPRRGATRRPAAGRRPPPVPRRTPREHPPRGSARPRLGVGPEPASRRGLERPPGRLRARPRGAGDGPAIRTRTRTRARPLPDAFARSKGRPTLFHPDAVDGPRRNRPRRPSRPPTWQPRSMTWAASTATWTAPRRPRPPTGGRPPC